MILLISPILAMLVTILLVPVCMRWAEKMELVDLPDERKVHQVSIPRIGGVAMGIGAMVPILLWGPFSEEVVAILISAVTILLFGLWDDKSNINFKMKIVGQLLASILLVSASDIQVRSLPFMAGETLPDIIAVPLTIILLLGITNALNLVDGLDGLAGGTTLLAFGMITIMAVSANLYYIALISLSVIGCILGFLRFNTHPATIFMGDAGSQFLGFVIGALVLWLAQHSQPVMSPAMPLLLLGLPILDTCLVFTVRILQGKSPFAPDKNHIHHRLIDVGFSHYSSVVALYSLQAVFVFSAYQLRHASDLTIVLTYLYICAFVLVFLQTVKHRDKLLTSFSKRAYRKLIEVMRGVASNRTFQSLLSGLIALTLPVFFACSFYFSDFSDKEVFGGGVLVGVVFLVAFGRVIQKHPSLERLFNILIYLLAIVSLFFTNSVTGEVAEAFSLVTSLLVYVIGFALLVVVMGQSDALFKTSPLDSLLILIALFVPNVPIADSVDFYSGAMIGKIIIVLYAAEFFVRKSLMFSRIFKLGVFGSCLFLLSGVMGTL